MGEKCEIVSALLVKKTAIAGFESRYYDSFCLGIPEWCPCCIRKAEKRKLLTLKRPRGKVDKETTVENTSNKETTVENTSNSTKKQKEHEGRFSFDVCDSELSKFKEGVSPPNTEKNTDWAVRAFEAWRVARNQKYTDEQCLEGVLSTADAKVLCEWLCKFIAETRKSDGTEYTPRSLYLLLAGIQRHLKRLNPDRDINIFQDTAFRPLKNVCDAVFKRLHSKGIGTETKVTPVLSQAEEDKLWESGVLSFDNPVGLLRAVFFYNGKNFCLRGGVEHRNLRLSQIQRETVVVGGKSMASYVYREFGSKNNQGGYASLNMQNKVVRQHESDLARCHVKILDKYLQVIPPDAKQSDVFYLKPISSTPTYPPAPWFTKVPIGKNRLNEMLKEMCRDAGIVGNFTNHSLRAYGATSLFQAGCSEKLIQQRTGHRSMEALRQYERTSDLQQVHVSNVMSGVKSTEKKGITVSSKTSPTIVLSGCSFTGCSITFSGSSMSPTKTQVTEEEYVGEVLQGLDVTDVFAD